MKLKATAQGIETIKKEIASLKEQLADVRSEKNIAYHNTGDTWHDNPMFVNLEQEEKQIYRQLVGLERKLASIDVIKVDGTQKDKVTIGAIFLCKSYANDVEKEHYFEITGHGESNLMQGKMRYDSPLATTLNHACKSDKVLFNGPKGDIVYEIIKFFDSWDEVQAYRKP